MIKLAKSNFFREKETKRELAKFIKRAKKLSMDREVARFERSFAKWQGRRFAVMVNSGSSANLLLIQALLNLGRLKKGDTIGVSVLTWSTNVMPILSLGLRPVAIDCEIETLSVSPKTLATHVPRLKVLFLTNVLGLADDIDAIRKMCAKNKVILLEDNCEALGSETSGRLLGNFGLAATFSFYVGHHLSTIEGGMVVTNDRGLYLALLLARAHGWDRNLPPAKQRRLRRQYRVDDFFSLYTFYDIGYNLRPTEIQGFLGSITLPFLRTMIRAREWNFKFLAKTMRGNHDFLPLKTKHMKVFSNFAVPLVCRNRGVFERYRARFKKANVEIRPIIAGAITKHPFYRKYVRRPEKCPNAEFIHQNAFYFPNNSELTMSELRLLKRLVSGGF